MSYCKMPTSSPEGYFRTLATTTKPLFSSVGTKRGKAHFVFWLLVILQQLQCVSLRTVPKIKIIFFPPKIVDFFFLGKKVVVY